MSLRVYTTLTRQKEPFVPVRPGKVGMYLCGPTVYKSPHIGHMVGPVIFDAIKRYLVYKGFEVTFVVNITDVDDKLIDAAKKQNSPVDALATKYTREYLDVLAAMGVASIDRFPKASEHMAEIIELCQKLIASAHAYAAEGNVWFDVTKDPDYGALSGRKVEEQASGLRDLEGGGKRNPADFALWKAAKSGEPAWDSPWGAGRPGWHIECSAMAMKYLGETFDMHGGGLDLMFPHHENERAQSECATGKPFAKYWMHNGLTRIKTKLASGEWADEKMSGSLGNVVPVTDLLARHGPELLRYLILQTHYRRPIEFTDDVLTASRKALSVFHRLFERLERLGIVLINDTPDLDALAKEMLSSEGNDAFTRDVLALKMKYLESMDDDFNTAGAISVLHEMAGEINGHIERSGAERNKNPEVMQAISGAPMTLVRLGRVLGLFVELKPAFNGAPQDDELTEKLMQLLIKLRANARQSKHFALADDIRKGLTEIGVTLEDRPDGTGWRRD